MSNLKGKENGSCNVTDCQKPSTVKWYSHGNYAWFCESCRNDIEFDPFKKRDWDVDEDASNYFIESTLTGDM